MCLEIKKGAKPKIAKKDIVVWKHIIKEDDNFVTSYQYATVTFDELITSEINIDETIINEALHSFVKFEDAKIRAEHYYEVLVKCIIPKGSTYYKGVFEVNWTKYASYASNQLIYKEIVEY